MRIADNDQSVKNQSGQSSRAGGTRAVDPGGGKPASSGNKAAAQSSDSIQLSVLSGRVAQGLQTDSASRARKVSEISAAVQGGSYRVDSKAVSQALVQHALAASGDTDGENNGK